MVAIKKLLDFSATLTALLCLAPVAPFLSAPVLALAGIALVGGWWCDRRGRYLLGARPATLLALTGVAWHALQIRQAAEIGAPLVNALAVLLAVRLLSAKQSRDYLQIFVLALFILAGSSLLTLDIGFIVYLVLLVCVVTVSLVLLTVFVTDPRLAMPSRDLWRLLRVALLLPVASLVLMLAFFVILPRTASPLWNFLNPAGEAVAGLAESVSPGAFAQLNAVRSLAFRAEGPELAPEDRYWRALVLNQPEGGQWVRRNPPAEGGVRVVGGIPATLTIYPEPRADRYLVTLDRPLQLGGTRSQPSPDQVFQAVAAGNRRFRYTVQAAAGSDLQTGRLIRRDFYLTVPELMSPRVAAVAARIAASGPGSAERLESLAEFFRQARLVYARDDLPGGPDPVDAFLFEKRRGYCEFFAAAYLTLARRAGIPARMVGGYYGGDYNELGGYYLVTDDTAHVWVEVLTDAGLWQRVDPSQWAINAGTALGAAGGVRLGPWQRLADAVNYQWVQLVVVFDLNQQLELWRSARGTWHDWRVAGPPPWLWLTAGLPVLGMLLTAVLIKRRRTSRQERLLAALRHRARSRLGAGVVVESLGLSELAERLDSAPCREFAAIYQGAVFRDRPLTSAEVARLKALLRKI